MKKILLSLMAVAGLLLSLGAITAPAQAADTDVKIVRISMDAVGADTLTNRWREFVDFKNVGDAEVNVKGWVLTDKWSHNNDNNPKGCNTITFRKATSVTDAGGFQHLSTHDDGLWLPKGHTIRVYTGGDEDSTDNTLHTVAINKANCGYKGHYLNNNADRVFLSNATGDVVDSEGYNWKGANFLSFS
jgi:hypothetical protein